MDLRVQWLWGRGTRITVSEYDVVGESLTFHGFSALHGTELILAHRGRVLDERFTFHHHGVRPGDLIICQLKRIPTKEKSQRFLSSLAKRRQIPLPAASERDSSARVAEQARLSDLAFAAWECHPRLPTILRDLLSDRSDSGDFDEEDTGANVGRGGAGRQ
jgi:hypothetical protein